MKFNYRLAKSARRNPQEISDYWTTKVGPESAVRIVAEIFETIITLSEQPAAGVAAGQFGVGVRKLPAGKYLVYYRRFRTKGVEILHVFHGARDQRKAWKE
jgi:plasmid stabilization system protein ParE